MKNGGDGSARSSAAVFYHPDGYVTAGRDMLMGRHAAGEGFLQGFARHTSGDVLYAFAESRQHFEQFTRQVAPHAGPRTTAWIPHSEPERLDAPGAVFIPGPGLAEHAWLRRCRGERAWSLTGITHTICTIRTMAALGELLTGPVEEWDAVICPSAAVRDGAVAILAAYGDYLAERFGVAAIRAKVQLPVIALGVDCDRFAEKPDEEARRRALRERHGIGRDDVAVLFFGRLSFHAKAHPLPMYQALQSAAERSGRKLHLILAGWFANDAIRESFMEGARALCPSVNVVLADGRQQQVRDDIRRAADIFCSLSDNVQETFGLTPVEAMAAGLPVVASDWDGYRGTVIDGETGFLVPTLMSPPGSGEDLAYRYLTGRDSYDQFIGNASQAVAVDAAAVAEAFTALAGNAELRRQMGQRGSERARRLFDWSVIIAQYEELWGELEQRRAAAADTPGRPAPLCGDPFAIYRHYPTRVIEPDLVLAAASADPWRSLQGLAALKMNRFARSTLAADDEIRRLVLRLEDAGGQGATAAVLLAETPPERRPALQRTLAWLAKLGIVKRL
jgi:starch synthase